MSESRNPLYQPDVHRLRRVPGALPSDQHAQPIHIRASIMTDTPHPMLTAERELGLTRIIRASPEKLFRAWRRW